MDLLIYLLYLQFQWFNIRNNYKILRELIKFKIVRFNVKIDRVILSDLNLVIINNQKLFKMIIKLQDSYINLVNLEIFEKILE